MSLERFPTRVLLVHVEYIGRFGVARNNVVENARFFLCQGNESAEEVFSFVSLVWLCEELCATKFSVMIRTSSGFCVGMNGLGETKRNVRLY